MESRQLAATEHDWFGWEEAEDPFPVAPLLHGAANAVEQFPNSSSCFPGLPSSFSSKQYMLRARRTKSVDDKENPHPLYGYSCSLVLGRGTEMEAEVDVAYEIKTVKDLQTLKPELTYLSIDSG